MSEQEDRIDAIERAVVNQGKNLQDIGNAMMLLLQKSGIADEKGQPVQAPQPERKSASIGQRSGPAPNRAPPAARRSAAAVPSEENVPNIRTLADRNPSVEQLQRELENERQKRQMLHRDLKEANARNKRLRDEIAELREMASEELTERGLQRVVDRASAADGEARA